MNDQKQKIKKRIKKLQLKSELCALELEEATETDEKHAKEFSKDFELEMLFLQQKKAEKNSSSNQEKIKHQPQGKSQNNDDRPIKIVNHEAEGLKRLHKKLAFELHPDRGRRENHEDFLELQSAWENQDYDSLLGISSKAQLDLTDILDDQSIIALESKLSQREKKLQSIKKSMRWIWGESNKSSKLKLFIRKGLGINEKEFQSWLESMPEKDKNTEENDVPQPFNEFRALEPARKTLP